ncbi:FAD:protein FMN transferase [Planctomycetota bacterium]
MDEGVERFSIIIEDQALKLPLHRFAHEAMGTIFGVSILDGKAEYAQSAARVAFEEVDRLERLMSRFIEGSDVWRINHLNPGSWTPVDADTLRCIQLAQQITTETNGAFDITIGPLITYWQQVNRPAKPDNEQAFHEAAVRTGMELLEISESAHGVGVRAEGVQIDLGGIGKGYAVDRMMEILKEREIPTALAHGGQSTVLAAGAIPGGEGWPLTLCNPQNPSKVWTKLFLRDRALSGSGLLIQNEHIIDPGTCEPVRDKLRAWAQAESAAVSDALATAFMVMAKNQVQQYCKNHKHTGAVLALVTEDGCKMEILGTEITK